MRGFCEHFRTSRRVDVSFFVARTYLGMSLNRGHKIVVFLLVAFKPTWKRHAQKNTRVRTSTFVALVVVSSFCGFSVTHPHVKHSALYTFLISRERIVNFANSPIRQTQLKGAPWECGLCQTSGSSKCQMLGVEHEGLMLRSEHDVLWSDVQRIALNKTQLH